MTDRDMGTWSGQTNGTVRILAATALGVVVTSLLLLLMYTLISVGLELDRERRTEVTTDVVRIEEERVRRDIERPRTEEPPLPRRSPPLPQLRTADRHQFAYMVIPVEDPGSPTLELSISDPKVGLWSSFGSTEIDNLIPLGRPLPEFPQKALIEGISGWVDVTFTVGADGRVLDASVVASEPDRLFDTAALKAVLRWRFKPPIVDAEYVEQRAQVRLEFQIDGAL